MRPVSQSLIKPIQTKNLKVSIKHSEMKQVLILWWQQRTADVNGHQDSFTSLEESGGNISPARSRLFNIPCLTDLKLLIIRTFTPPPPVIVSSVLSFQNPSIPRVQSQKRAKTETKSPKMPTHPPTLPWLHLRLCHIFMVFGRMKKKPKPDIKLKDFYKNKSEENFCFGFHFFVLFWRK